jgi:eukaryotic-like serine/threonine-protein kinase
MIGRTVGHYRLVNMIGAGGMGEVYVAHDARLNRDVAVKILRTGILSDEAARKRFRQEARMLAKLSHPNIATIYDFSTENGTDFLVMELVDGVSLAQKLAGGPLTEKEIGAIGTQIADALEEAHDRGLIHRDLKPGNVMLTPKGRVKVLDWGLARLLHVSSDMSTADLAQTRAVAGTLPYMSPEQLRNEDLDGRADIYAAGAVIYEMATGQRAFTADSSPQLTDAILHRAPVAPRALNPKMSLEVERTILKCLDKDPDYRYQSAKELGVDLRRLAGPSSAVTSPVVHRRGIPWKGVIPSVAGIVLVVALAVAFNVSGLREHLTTNSNVPPIRSLAVLPLENLSGDSSQDYFAEGMTDELTTEIAQISALRVISRMSATRYRRSGKSLPDIAKKLRVDAVVEGTVTRSGDHVRITAQLIQASSDTHLWAKDYERNLSDVLSLQNEVARDIASEIRIKLTPEEQGRLVASRPVNPEAHDAYLKGRYHWDKDTEEQYKEAKGYFLQALELDPNYAPADAGLASYYWATSELAPRVAMPKAKEYALKALTIDDTLSDAHTALAVVNFYADWDWSGAEKEFKRAIELNPSDAEAHRMYSVYLSAMGRTDGALAEIRAAENLDPVSISTTSNAGWTLYFARQYDRAIEQCQKALEADPSNVGAHDCIGYAYMAKGDYDKAIEECTTAATLSGNDPVRLAGLGRAYALAGKTTEARRVIADLRNASKQHYVPPYFVATVYTALGEKDEAFSWLEQAHADRDSYLTWVKVDDALDPLRSDARFANLLRRINLPL